MAAFKLADSTLRIINLVNDGPNINTVTHRVCAEPGLAWICLLCLYDDDADKQKRLAMYMS